MRPAYGQGPAAPISEDQRAVSDIRGIMTRAPAMRLKTTPPTSGIHHDTRPRRMVAHVAVVVDRRRGAEEHPAPEGRSVADDRPGEDAEHVGEQAELAHPRVVRGRRGAVVLEAFPAVPLQHVDAQPEVAGLHRFVGQAIERGVAFLLEDGRLADAAYPGPAGRQIHPLWFDLNFPLFYQADILFALRVLAELEVLDRPGAAPALTWLATRCREGRWRGCNPYGNRTWPDLRSRAETNRWVTLQAQRILMRAPRHRLLAGA